MSHVDIQIISIIGEDNPVNKDVEMYENMIANHGYVTSHIDVDPSEYRDYDNFTKFMDASANTTTALTVVWVEKDTVKNLDFIRKWCTERMFPFVIYGESDAQLPYNEDFGEMLILRDIVLLVQFSKEFMVITNSHFNSKDLLKKDHEKFFTTINNLVLKYAAK